MTIYLPPRVSRELAERTASFNQDILRSIEIDSTDPLLLEYTLKLQAIHPRLLMVRALEHVIPGVPMKPGYYHVLVRSEGAPWSVSVIEGAIGEFVEPTSRVLEKIAAGDMHEQRNLDRFAAHERDEREAEKRDQVRARDERQDHLQELVNAYTRTSVSTTDAIPWTQNAQPAANRDRGERTKP